MTGATVDPRGWLGQARIDDAVLALRPDYAALLIVADELSPGPVTTTPTNCCAPPRTRPASLSAGAARQSWPRSPTGGAPISPSGPGRAAPGRVSRHCCGARTPACPG